MVQTALRLELESWQAQQQVLVLEQLPWSQELLLLEQALELRMAWLPQELSVRQQVWLICPRPWQGLLEQEWSELQVLE